MANRYRKKPVIIEAIQWNGDNLKEIIDFTGLHPSANKWTWDKYTEVVKELGLKIFTKEGFLTATIGDWVVKGYSSEQGFHYWPVKSDYFAENYEKVEE